MSWVARAKEEHKEVAGRLNALSGFMKTEDFRKLSKTHQNLLTMQGLAMSQYVAALLSRIEEPDGEG